MTQLELPGLYKMYKPKERTYYILDYRDIEYTLKSVFPNVEYDFVSDEEANNDNVYTYNDVGIEDFSKWLDWDNIKWNRLINNEVSSFHTRRVLEWLVAHGVLPAGNYLIEVSW